jgi:hypothetical protein
MLEKGENASPELVPDWHFFTITAWHQKVVSGKEALRGSLVNILVFLSQKSHLGRERKFLQLLACFSKTYAVCKECL